MTRTIDGCLENGRIVTSEQPAANEDKAPCLVTVFDDSVEDLRRQGAATMPSAKQRRVSDLLAVHGEGRLSPKEQQELDALLAEAHELDLRKAEAAAVLRELGE